MTTYRLLAVAVLPTGLRVRNEDRTFDYALFNGPRTGPVAVAPAPTVAAHESPAR